MNKYEESDDDIMQNNVSEYEDTSDSDTELQVQIKRSQNIEPICDYMTAAQSIVKPSIHPTSNTQQALIINKRLQEYLKILKSNLENLLEKCRQKYKHNEQVHDQIRSKTEKYRLGRQHSYYLCGYPFFKDERLFSAPPNQHYLYRRKTLNELFPMDIQDYTVNWNTRDKISLIQGVKIQIINALASKNRDNARKSIKCTRVGGIQKKLEVIERNKSLEKLMLSELYEMLLKEKITFKIDWFTISAEKLDDRHPPKQCMALWNAYLMPTLNRNRWTKDDEEKLHKIVQKYNYQNWTEIAKNITGRSAYQCFVHYQSMMALMNIQRNVRFTPEEDRLLVQTIEKYRIGSVIPWSIVVEKMPGRTKCQVYNRYMWSIKPGIKKDKFSVEEDCILTAAVKEYGTNFHKFPRDLLPGRTLVQIRNRYNNVLKFVHTNKQHWSPETDKKLMQLFDKYGSKHWTKIADEMDGFSRLQCRGRYQTIKRFLDKNPNSTIDDVPKKNTSSRTNVTADNWMETIIRVKQAQQNGICDEFKPMFSGNTPVLTMDIYQYFKYAYRFKFLPICMPHKLTTDTNHVAAHLLQNKICPRDFKILIEPRGGTIDMEYNKFADCIPNDYVFPPSWCTAQLFRGLEIMFSDDKVLGESSAPSSSSKTIKTTTELNDTQIFNYQLLRERLFSLLYSTIICSRLELPMIDSCNDKDNDSNDYDDNDDEDDDFESDNENTDEEYVCDKNEINIIPSDEDVKPKCFEYNDNLIEIADYKISPNDMLRQNNVTNPTNNFIDDQQRPCTSKQAIKNLSTNNKSVDNTTKVLCYELQSNSNDGNYKICLVNNEIESKSIQTSHLDNVVKNTNTKLSAIKRSLSPQNIDLDRNSVKRVRKT